MFLFGRPATDAEKKMVADVEFAIAELVKHIEKQRRKLYGPGRVEQDEIKRILYNIYNRDAKMNYMLRDMYGELKLRWRYKREVYDKNKRFVEKLKTAETWSKNVAAYYKDNIFVSYDREFCKVITASFDYKNVRRLYLNCDPEHIEKVVKSLLDFLSESRGLVKLQFKFPRHDVAEKHIGMLIRTDKLVIYYRADDMDTHFKLHDMVGRLRGYLKPSTPLFTRLTGHEGAALAFEPPPSAQKYAGPRGEVLSFGEFIAAVIAEELSGWCIANSKHPSGGEIRSIAENIVLNRLSKEHGYGSTWT